MFGIRKVLTMQNNEKAVQSSNNYDLYTINEVADILRVDPGTVRRWGYNGIFPLVALPSGPNGRAGGYRVRKSDVDKLLGVTV